MAKKLRFDDDYEYGYDEDDGDRKRDKNSLREQRRGERRKKMNGTWDNLEKGESHDYC